MKKIFTLIGLLATTLLLAACGAGGGGSANAELDEQTAAEYEQMAVQGNDFQLAMLQDPISIQAASVKTLSGNQVPRPLVRMMSMSGVSSQQTDNCVTESGNTTDADGDTVPVNATYTYDCHSDPSSGYTYSITGTVAMADKNDADANSGYSMQMTDLKYEFGDGSSTSTLVFDLDFDLTISGATYTATFDFGFSGNGPDGSFSIGFDFDQTYVADNVSNPFASGTLTFNGDLNLNDDGDRYSLNVASDPSLAVDENCSTGFASGASKYSDNAGNNVKVSYACDSASATYNGSPIASN